MFECNEVTCTGTGIQYGRSLIGISFYPNPEPFQNDANPEHLFAVFLFYLLKEFEV
jgi:hypothetical protein